MVREVGDRRLSRRRLVGAGAASLVAVTAAQLSGGSAVSAAQPAPTSADAALTRLLEGNQRYVRAGALGPNQSGARRLEVAAGQHPFALVLSCMDSRVPPELVFDQGLGDVFAVRVAGAVVEASIEGSIEYAAAKFGVPLVLVVGHTACGAVEATVEVMTEGGTAAGSIAELVTLIRPAVEAVQDLPGDLVDNAARANVRLTVAHLRASDPVLSKLVAVGALAVVGGYYDLETGVVEIIDR